MNKICRKCWKANFSENKKMEDYLCKIGEECYNCLSIEYSKEELREVTLRNVKDIVNKNNQNIKEVAKNV